MRRLKAHLGRRTRESPRLALALACVLTVLSGTSVARAAPVQTLSLDRLTEGQALGPSLVFFEERGRRLSVAEVLATDASQREAVHAAIPNFGLVRSAFWFQVRLHNPDMQARERMARIAPPAADEIDLYLVGARGQLLSELHTGSRMPVTERAIHHRDVLFPIEVPGAQTVTLLVRLRSSIGLQLPLTLWTEPGFIAHDQSLTLLQGIYVGFMLVMVLYNLFLFVTLRERTYAFYVPMVAGQLLFQVTAHGLANQYLWPSLPELNRLLSPSIVFFATWSANAFAMSFLDLPRRDARWSQAAKVVRTASLWGAVVAPLLPFDLGIALGCGAATATAITVLGAFVRLWNEARRQVLMLGLAWTPLLVGTLVLVAEKLGLLPRTFWSENLTQIGSAIEVVGLSFALGDRINQEREQRLRAQELALVHERSAQRAQQSALSIERRANETLEERVEARTRELAEANQRLAAMSTFDPVTGLRNRRYFSERHHGELARALREQKPLGLLLIEIDHFAQIDEVRGSAAGDQSLRAVADVLRATVTRATDTVAHHRAEEFVVLLPGTDLAGALVVAETIRAAVEEVPLEVASELINLTVSVGVASAIPEREGRREMLTGAARDALDRARRQGGNRVQAA